MIELNLIAADKEQELIKNYLEENVTDVLAEKINNGVKTEKDGMTLINKKTLDGFMRYATEEAKKLAEKGANAACVEDKVGFGWAIHYFEEDSIEGILYNEDGSEYKPKITPKKTETQNISVVKPTPKKPAQQSLFDLLEDNEAQETTEETQPEKETEHICEMEGLRVNTETGEVIQKQPETVDDLIGILFGIFKDELEDKR